MSGFDATWLDLREPADRAARDARLRQRAADWANARGGAIVDLGCGTGSTARAMADLLAPDTAWRLVDRDPLLLEQAAKRIGPRAQTFQADLSAISSLPLDGASLLTASALFDLVSADWVDAFVAAVCGRGAALYAALTYDGRTTWSPGHAEDAGILGAFNRHQQSDKGLGPALGPDGTRCLADALTAKGFAVETAPSDWRLGAWAAALAAEHAEGVARAATEAGMAPDLTEEWLSFRRIEAGRGETIVGHLDLFAYPMEASGRAPTPPA